MSERRKKARSAARTGRLRARPVKSSMVRAVLVVAGDLGDDGEGADVHGGVGGGVEAGGGDAVGGEGGEGDEQVAGVGDGGVGEHALDVALEQGAEVADGHGEGGEDPEEDGPAVLHARGSRRR